MNVTVLGGTGLLGRHLSPLLVERGHRVTITGRSVATEPGPGLRGVRVDLAGGAGITEAIDDAESVVHLASDSSQPTTVDVDGTARLLELIGDRHLTYISIVGVDRHPLPYYQGKLATERLIEDAGGLYTILRATQSHDLIAFWIGRMTRHPIGVIPKGFVYQPIAVEEVAAELASLVETRPQGTAPDLAGPQVLGIEHLARTYLAASDTPKPVVKVPRFGPAPRASRAGVLTNPQRAMGKITWAEYLAGRFATR